MKLVPAFQSFHEQVPLWPGDPPVQFQTVASIPEHGYHLRKFSIGEHTGTHLNAPNCFLLDGCDVVSLIHKHNVLGRSFPCVVVDISDTVSVNSAYQLQVSDVDGLTFPKDCIVFVYTGWSEQFWNRQDGSFVASPFPGVSLAAAQFLIDHCGAAGLAIDTHGIDGSADPEFSVNCWAAAKESLVLECVALTRAHVAASYTDCIIAPLLLQGGTGAPVSVFFVAPS
jgi:kynurenine formamidase